MVEKHDELEVNNFGKRRSSLSKFGEKGDLLNFDRIYWTNSARRNLIIKNKMAKTWRVYPKFVY